MDTGNYRFKAGVPADRTAELANYDTAAAQAMTVYRFFSPNPPGYSFVNRTDRHVDANLLRWEDDGGWRPGELGSVK